MDCYGFRCGSYISVGGIYLSSATDSFGNVATMDLIRELLWCTTDFADDYGLLHTLGIMFTVIVRIQFANREIFAGYLLESRSRVKLRQDQPRYHITPSSYLRHVILWLRVDYNTMNARTPCEMDSVTNE